SSRCRAPSPHIGGPANEQHDAGREHPAGRRGDDRGRRGPRGDRARRGLEEAAAAVAPDDRREPRGREDVPLLLVATETFQASPFFGLTTEQERLRAEVRRFAVEQVAPRARVREWEPDARERVDWELVEEASRRGWRTLGLPREDGDMGFAVVLDQTLKVQRIVSELAGGEARKRFLARFVDDPRCVLAICFTEPETSSDYIIPSPALSFRTRAERLPDGSWRLDGYKRFISNGADAGFYVVFACTDDSRPAHAGTSAFLLEPGLPGFEVETIHEKISQRTINNAALRFDGVVIEPWRLLGDPHLGYAGARAILKESVIEAGATTRGTAHAAYDLALAHASERVQGGRRLIEHANVACR